MTNENYSELRCTWLFCGTVALVSMDSIESGERFLNYKKEVE